MLRLAGLCLCSLIDSAHCPPPHSVVSAAAVKETSQNPKLCSAHFGYCRVPPLPAAPNNVMLSNLLDLSQVEIKLFNFTFIDILSETTFIRCHFRLLIHNERSMKLQRRLRPNKAAQPNQITMESKSVWDGRELGLCACVRAR